MYHLILDVKSIGLQGEAFAIGWVLLQTIGIEVDSGMLACSPTTASGTAEAHEWVQAYVPVMEYNCLNSQILRAMFTGIMNMYSERGRNQLRVYAECPWPVETNFLSQCVREHCLTPPYPLYDISSLMLAKGIDPVLPYGRLPLELPEHDPLNDARQSARILRELYLV